MRCMKQSLLSFLLCSLLFTTGCSPFTENNLVEEIAPVIFWYVQDTGDGNLQITTLVPPLVKEKKRMFTVKVSMLKQGGKDFNLAYYRELKTGQLRMVLIDEKLAKKGVLTLFNTMLMDPDISQRLYVVIIKGNFNDYINDQLEKQEDLDYFIYRLFKHYEKYNQGEMSIVNLHQFIKQYYQSLSYPIMPVFEADKDNFMYSGTAFFDHDKLKSTVTDMQEQIFQIMDNDHFLKLLPLPPLSVTLGRVRSNVNIKINPDKTAAKVNVYLNTRIEEYKGNKNVFAQKDLNTLTEKIESYMEKKTTALLKTMQQKKVDPLQIGYETVTPFSKQINNKMWIEKWKNMNIKVIYHVKLEPLSNTR